jgi:EmrB/QacA subfamily drug resistance transporter
LVLFALASACCALAPSAEALIAARVVQGIGAGVVTPLSLTILSAAFPPERRGAMVGIWGGIAGLATTFGPFLGGAITQGLSWHWIFWLNVPIGGLAAILATVRLAESHGPPTRLDPPAVVLVSGGSIGVVLGLVRAADLGWGSAQTLTTLGIGIVLLACFVGWERRVREPMLPMRLFRSRTFSAAGATAFFMSGTVTASVFLVAQYFQLALGYPPLEAGLRMMPWTATPLFFAPLGGALSDRVGRRPLMVGGMVLAGVGLAWFARLAGTGVAYWPSMIPLVIAGIGLALALPVTPTAVLSAVAPRDMGKASGVTSTLQRFGSAFVVAIATAVFASNGGLGTASAFVDGFRPALVVVAALAGVGAVTALAVGRRQSIAVAPAVVAGGATEGTPIAAARIPEAADGVAKQSGEAVE